MIGKAVDLANDARLPLDPSNLDIYDFYPKLSLSMRIWYNDYKINFLPRHGWIYIYTNIDIYCY